MISLSHLMAKMMHWKNSASVTFRQFRVCVLLDALSSMTRTSLKALTVDGFFDDICEEQTILELISRVSSLKNVNKLTFQAWPRYSRFPPFPVSVSPFPVMKSTLWKLVHAVRDSNALTKFSTTLFDRGSEMDRAVDFYIMQHKHTRRLLAFPMPVMLSMFAHILESYWADKVGS